MDIKREIPNIKQCRKDIYDVIESVRKLESCKEVEICIIIHQEACMWLGMDLKRLNDINPYPSSKDPSTGTKIEPTADNLHF